MVQCVIYECCIYYTVFNVLGDNKLVHCHSMCKVRKTKTCLPWSKWWGGQFLYLYPFNKCLLLLYSLLFTSHDCNLSYCDLFLSLTIPAPNVWSNWLALKSQLQKKKSVVTRFKWNVLFDGISNWKHADEFSTKFVLVSGFCCKNQFL